MTRVVYIVGSPRGGTGILGRVLSTINSTTHGGELRRLWERGLRSGVTCDCGRTHRDCPIWSKLLVPGASYLEPNLDELASIQRAAAPASRTWWHALKVLYRRSASQTSSAEGRYLGFYSDLYKAIARVSGSRVIIDNSKHPVDAALLARAPDLDVTCVQIVRDPRGVVFSRHTRAFPDDPHGSHPIEALKTAAYWMIRHLTFDAIRRRYGTERSLVVIYEELMEDPNSAVRRTSRLLGQSPPSAQLRPDHPLAMPEVHGPDAGRKQRFANTDVVLTKDERWRSALHPFDKALVTLLTLPLLVRYGYPIRATASDSHPKPVSQEP